MNNFEAAESIHFCNYCNQFSWNFIPHAFSQFH